MRTGRQYLESLDDGRQVFLGGRRVPDVAGHPALRGCAQAIAGLYDQHHDPALGDLLTMESPSGERASLAWLIPKSAADLERRRRMIEHLVRQQGGTMGRLPDYVPLILLGLLAAKGALARFSPRWAENVERYFGACRDRDLFLTHSFADRQIDRSKPSAALDHLHVAGRDGDHLVVRGTKTMATMSPLANEYLVLTPPRAGLAPHQALFFAVPVNSPRLRFVCREPLSAGDPADHPLSARFDEMDASAIFDDVRVPPERVFLAEDVEALQTVWRLVNVFAYYHIVIRMAAKAELFAGVCSLIARQLGTAQFERVKEKIAEIVRHVETMRAFLRSAESDAVTTRDGIAMPNPRATMVAHMHAVEQYPRLVLSVLSLSGQSLLTTPTTADLAGDEGPELERSLSGGPLAPADRARLFRLARDLACGSFASRQLLFELFNGRDLARNRLAFIEGYDLSPFERTACRLAGIEQTPAPSAAKREGR
ncbi:MAG TPA: 4-hydroxyphenylacetate 3-hydroxylase N-terminal domain-containing protein [Polyangiaceae bacterium]|nr:4-hydroxyphenylacetate 3-hydroxylase N-terminal domain-containing protein [Polyangiaceae bacterium]